MSASVELQVNGQPVRCTPHAAMPLIELLRDELALTGTHPGCDTAQCGACTVLVDGAAVKSCNVLVMQLPGSRVQTIESLAPAEGPLHVMQRAFSRHHALQCGYCTPGLLMRAVAMAAEDVPIEEDAVRAALSGNLCRCTGYRGIVRAVCEGLRVMRGEAGEDTILGFDTTATSAAHGSSTLADQAPGVCP